MKHLFLVALLAVGLLADTSALFAQGVGGLMPDPFGSANLRSVPSAERMLNNNSQGREFWFCIPKNDAGAPPADIAIFVTSRFATRFTIKGADGTTINKQISRPLQVITVGGQGSTEVPAAAWEMDQSERVTRQGIQIIADEPISVYVMSTRSATADGFLAIPVDALGKNYIHCGYYDHGEFTWGGTFGVVALEDNTQVVIRLRGRNAAGALGRTAGGRSIGESWSVRLNKGETYMVRGNGLSWGLFDITGTSVRATKPVGFVGGHQRTGLPSLGGNNRDHLVEMLPPVEAWGRRYATVEVDRGSPSQGDFMRVVASEDNTTVRIRWWRKDSDRRLISDRTETLAKAGDWWEFQQNFDPNPQNRIGVVGTSLWEADKPVLVMQYSYSGFAWQANNNDNLDPFMMLVTPEEQFTKGTIFQTPVDNRFGDHNFGLVVKGDPNDPVKNDQLLKSVKFDGTPVFQLSSAFLGNRIPETDLYWAYIKTGPGAHIVEGDALFGGYVYGFGSVISYGWPAATALNKIDVLDTLAPEVFISGPCGNLDVLVTEKRNSPGGTPPNRIEPQIDQGIRNVDLIAAENFELVYPASGRPVPRDSVIEYRFKLRVLNLRLPGFAVVRVDDRVGNERFDTVYYEPEFVELRRRDTDMGEVLVGQTVRQSTWLLNPTENEIEVSSFTLRRRNEGFRIVEPVIPPNIKIAAGDSVLVTFEYSPTQEHLPNELGNSDSVFATTKCGEFALGRLIGRGILPVLRVADWNAGEVVIGTTREMTIGLRLENIGTAPLTVTGISDVAGENVQLPFAISNPTTPAFPIVLDPKGTRTVQLRMPSVTPRNGVEVPGTPVVINVKFLSNTAPSGKGGTAKEVSEWRVIPVIPQELITEYDWLEQRVLTTGHRADIIISNEGNTATMLTGVRLRDNGDGGAFTIRSMTYQGRNANYPLQLNAGERVTVNVEFNPLAEQTYEDAVVAEFQNGKTLEGRIAGIGIIPAYAGERSDFGRYNIEFVTGTAEEVDFYISNTSTSEDMYVRNIRIVNEQATVNVPGGQTFNAPGVFTFVNQPTEPLFVAKGGRVPVRMAFTPRRDAAWSGLDFTFRGSLDFETNDVPGPDTTNWNDQSLALKGEGFLLVRDINVAVENVNASLINNCSDTAVIVTITNPSTTGPINITGFVLTDDNNNVFQVVDFIDEFGNAIPAGNVPYSLLAEKSIRLRIRFRPTTPGTYTAKIRIENDARTETRDIRAVAEHLPMSLTIRDNTAKDGYLPGESFDMRIAVTSQNPQALPTYGVYAGKRIINIVRFVLAYDYVEGGQLPLRLNPTSGTGGITVNSTNWALREDPQPVVISPTRRGVVITLQANGNIASEADLPTITARFDLFVFDLENINISVSDLAFFTADIANPDNTLPLLQCIPTQGAASTVNLADYCLQNNRAIKFSGVKFRLAPPKPNPVQNSGRLEYAVGFEVATRIALYNSLGEEVMVLVDGVRPAGEYSLALPVKELPSGVYVCKMTAGPFTESQQIIISK